MNNWWEDMDNNEEIKQVHNEYVKDMDIPSWAIITCPYCCKKLTPRSVRSIGLHFNARNIGDVSVEFCCEDCKKMDTVYFRNEAPNIQNFIRLLDCKFPDEFPKSTMLIEDKMYALQYNNLMEKYFTEKE